MGLLFLGTPLAWDEARQYADHVRTHGITQFLHIWDRLKDRYGDELLWGDEVHPLRACSPRGPLLMTSAPLPPPSPQRVSFLAPCPWSRLYSARAGRVHGRNL